jgi:hypothetical protein
MASYACHSLLLTPDSLRIKKSDIIDQYSTYLTTY